MKGFTDKQKERNRVRIEKRTGRAIEVIDAVISRLTKLDDSIDWQSAEHTLIISALNNLRRANADLSSAHRRSSDSGSMYKYQR